MPTMRNLGSSGLQTPRLVLGGNVFGWTADKAASFKILDAFVARGGTMIDTADVYSSWAPGNKGGESETIIGEWLKRRGRRDDVLIATKVGLMDGLSAGTIAAGADASLGRLGIDCIDLYYSHKDDPEVPLEETLGAFDALVKAGKVRALGASQIEAERLREALAVSASNGFASYTVLQTWYNLVERPRYEGALSETVQENGLGMLSFFSLANGFLSGKYRSESDLGKSVRGDRVLQYLNSHGLSVLAALDDVAAETGSTQAQVALAWVAAQPSVTAPIASATSVVQLEELIGAMELELSADQLGRLDAAGRI
jgi:aryl-alcohol dehydrogenase-like predicted oxidoreductase